MRLLAIAALLAVLAGCAGGRTSGSGAAQAAADADISGNERGGRIANGLERSNAAYGSATAHCQNYGKKAFITKWDPPSDRGAIIFECK